MHHRQSIHQDKRRLPSLLQQLLLLLFAKDLSLCNTLLVGVDGAFLKDLQVNLNKEASASIAVTKIY
jgi:hypothetical protein